ncbi:MAG TPA: nuclear transport factor 2 family protein [Solirubrobacterales bacterium]|nr:nuclear transport factor 2 family protein [Solirubrobacterales bacterium]
MDGDNAETFRALAEAIARGDLDAVLERLHPEAEFETLRSAVQGTYRGHDGAREFLRDNEESFEVFIFKYQEIEELADGRVVAIGSIRIRGRGGGVELDVPTAAVAEFRDGLLFRYKDHGDADAARAAVG